MPFKWVQILFHVIGTEVIVFSIAQAKPSADKVVAMAMCSPSLLMKDQAYD